MTLFSALRGRSASSSDEKEHDSDSDQGGATNDDSLSSPSRARTPLLTDLSDSTNDNEGGSDDSFTIRIKLNDGKSTVDLSLDNVSPNDTTVQSLKEQILCQHFNDNDNDKDDPDSNVNRYLRLIVRGRMMAPDTSKLETFSIVKNDVIHAVLAKEGVRGGQQARMLRRLNHHNTNNNSRGSQNSTSGSASSASGTGGGSRSQQSLWRRIGIDANGVVVSPRNNENDETDEEDSEDESDFEDAHGEIDLEMGNNANSGDNGNGNNSGRQQRRRRRRERRGFDRLRATGMTRDEVTAIRLYFARSVDRYIERRRLMIRASQRIRNSLNDIVGSDSGGPSSSRRQRANTGESTNSLLDTEEDAAENAERGENNSTNSNNEGGNSNANDANSGNNAGGSDGSNNSSDNNEGTTYEGEEILSDRPRMEDEWMSTQGPYSEFRMNLNTSNPLLLAAITGGGAGNVATAGTEGTSPLDRTPAGLFFRSRNTGMGGGLDGLGDDEEDEMFGGSFTPNGRFVSSGPNGFSPYMGPLPSAGTDKDFVWGFILGFFVGFIMLFWVWMPTVPHKQKIGIISGISFQLGLNLLRKSGQAGVAGVV